MNLWRMYCIGHGIIWHHTAVFGTNTMLNQHQRRRNRNASIAYKVWLINNEHEHEHKTYHYLSIHYFYYYFNNTDRYCLLVTANTAIMNNERMAVISFCHIFTYAVIPTYRRRIDFRVICDGLNCSLLMETTFGFSHLKNIEYWFSVRTLSLFQLFLSTSYYHSYVTTYHCQSFKCWKWNENPWHQKTSAWLSEYYIY